MTIKMTNTNDKKCMNQQSKLIQHSDHDETTTECAYINREDINTNLINKKIGILLKRYKIEHIKNRKQFNFILLLKNKKKRIRKIKKARKLRKNKKKNLANDYLNILNSEKEYLNKYEQNKQFLNNIKKYDMNNELLNDGSYPIFFYNVFINGLYINKDSTKIIKSTDSQHLKKKNAINNNKENKEQCQNSSNKISDLKKKIYFFNGHQAIVSIADYFKILLNSLQNENIITKCFHFIEYAQMQENKEKDNMNYLQSYDIDNKKNEQSVISYDSNIFTDKNPLDSNSIEGTVNLPSNNNCENLPSHSLKNINTYEDKNENPIKTNDANFNKILNTFISELKAFFFSIISKVKLSKFISKLIVIFSKVCLLLTPYYLNTTHLIEILTEFANIIPIKFVKYFVNFFIKNKNDFIYKYKLFQNNVIFNDMIKIQTVGAKLIGFIKILQKKCNNSEKNESQNIFFLNILLSECLPNNHLGFCNRQSLKNNLNFFFYDSFKSHVNAANDRSLIYDQFQLNIKKNITNYEQLKNIIQSQIQDQLFQNENLDNHDQTSTHQLENNETSNHNTNSHTDTKIATNNSKTQSNNATASSVDAQVETEKGAENKNNRKRKLSEISPDNLNPEKNQKITSHEINIKNKPIENYNVYISYIYIIMFIKYPEMFVTEAKSELEDIYNAFKTFYFYIKKLKKTNILNINTVREYLYNSDFDFLGNRHIYNMLIHDENFLNIYFFKILMALNFLNCEHNILKKKKIIFKQETNNENKNDATPSNNNNTNEDKNSSSNTRVTKLNQKDAKENMNSNTSNTTAPTSNHNDNKNIKSKDIDTKNNSQNNSKISNEKTEEIMYNFMTDLINYLDHSKNYDHFKLLLSTEYCWYIWKKKFITKQSKDNIDTNFQFKNIDMLDTTKQYPDIENEANRYSKRIINNNSPLYNLINIIEHFETLNNIMNYYYEINQNNPNVTKNIYKYTKVLDNTPCENINNFQSISLPSLTNISDLNDISKTIFTSNELNDKSKKNILTNYSFLKNMNNYLLEINKIYLRREGEFWEIDDDETITNSKKQDNEHKLLIEKLIDKLEDYKKKMDIDNDPINEIEEDEKSKNNPVFKFRLAKLFILKYIDLYTIVKNKEFSTNCDFLYNLMLQMDKNLEQKKQLLDKALTEEEAPEPAEPQPT
ncbi:conserved Plasmodium protein, unknown function [Plasmodium chabaudi chabaudi]|uniref:Uncharacterized protein n=1 Tax=Plasmodium chabaudi chabaudi TaxID=31271 RepID=A0A1C6X8S9_PLACU|nr:conserved Plasmodium protein, unknown function [Plasmodium chabaudi chabaudi]